MYSQLKFHKTLPKSSLQMHWISVRFYDNDSIVYILFVSMIQFVCMENKLVI